MNLYQGRATGQFDELRKRMEIEDAERHDRLSCHFRRSQPPKAR
jgi:hypothetical protein